MIAGKNKAVFMHYTLKNDAGEVLDSSEGRDPLGFIQGIGNIIAGLDKQIEGKKAGDTFSATIPPEEAYGHQNDDLIQTASKEEFKELGDIKVGTRFHVQGPQGVAPGVITKIEGDTVTFDINHPLAGETLHFDVEITEVRDCTDEELDHGHIHGPGGHHH